MGEVSTNLRASNYDIKHTERSTVWKLSCFQVWIWHCDKKQWFCLTFCEVKVTAGRIIPALAMALNGLPWFFVLRGEDAPNGSNLNMCMTHECKFALDWNFFSTSIFFKSKSLLICEIILRQPRLPWFVAWWMWSSSSSSWGPAETDGNDSQVGRKRRRHSWFSLFFLFGEAK